MRALILVTAATLALAACGSNGQAGNTTNLDEGLTADSIVSNDVTAIDAVTGDAANMAADMDVDFTNETANGLANTATSSGPATKQPARPGPTPETPISNDAGANEATNSTAE